MSNIYVYQAIRRKKDNKNEDYDGPTCIREVTYTPAEEMEAHAKLVHTIQQYPGIWRIYRSVNARSFQKARTEFTHILVDMLSKPSEVVDLGSKWKSVLMHPAAAAERKFLLDIDTGDSETIMLLQSAIYGEEAVVLEQTLTPRGQHWVTTGFNPAAIKDVKDVEIKRDALLFVSIHEVKE